MTGIVVREINCKTALTKSKICDYVINPFTGCEFACRYCYAKLIVAKFSKHLEPWGNYVDVKVNAPEVLEKQLETARKGTVMLSSVTDPYQSLEKKFEVTRKCLEKLLEKQWPASILTKSDLVLRDIDLLKKFKKLEVGLTITTDKPEIKQLFEPFSPSTEARIQALKELKAAGIRAYAFLGPLLPMDAGKLVEELKGSIDYAFIDRMNYAFQTKKIYEENDLEFALKPEFFEETKKELVKGLQKHGIKIKALF